MAYLFLGTKAKKASNYNDVIRIYNKKAAAEMNVDEKYSYQLYITFGLWQQEQHLEVIATDELAELEKIKQDIVCLYEEIYGKHVEKHKIIQTYLKYVDEAVEAIRKMCQEIDKDLLDKVEDLSEIFQRRINEIKERLAKVIAKYVDPAKLTMETALEDLVENVSHLSGYKANSYQTYIDAMMTKFEEYLACKETEEAIRKDSFEKAVDKLIKFDSLGVFPLDAELDTEIYNQMRPDIEADVQRIKEQAAEIKKFTFADIQEKEYQFNQNDDYEHKGATHDLDEDGKIYVYGQDEPIDVDAPDAEGADFKTSDDTAIQILGQEKVDAIKAEVEGGDY